MIVRDALLQEHSREQALKIAGYACTSAKRFRELMDCFMSDEYRLAQRAAWSVSWAARKKPTMLFPHISGIVQALTKKGVHNAVVRNALRVLEEIEIPKVHHGEVMNACFQFIETASTPVASKAFSLTILYKLSKHYPEIKQELKLLIEERWDSETAAYRSRGKKILDQLLELTD